MPAPGRPRRLVAVLSVSLDDDAVCAFDVGCGGSFAWLASFVLNLLRKFNGLVALGFFLGCTVFDDGVFSAFSTNGVVLFSAVAVVSLAALSRTRFAA